MAKSFPNGKMQTAKSVAELKQSMQFILRADTGAAGKGQKSKKKAGANLKPLWDRTKLAVGDNFSSISYLKVDKIEGSTITVSNALGGSWIMSKDLLVKDAWSGDHFSREVKTSMTELASILIQCKDTIFTVSFKKKVDSSNVEEELKRIQNDIGDLSDASSIKQLTKSVTEGQLSVITGYLSDTENNLGRSLIIDLNAKGIPFRQVDHRTIEWIIFKNTKYSLGKKTVSEELPLKSPDVKWDQNKLAVGNWFSSTAYYKVKSITDKDNCVVSEAKDQSNELTMARDIMETEMNSGLVFGQEQKLSRTEVLEKMTNAGESVMTVTFNKKIDEAYIKSALENAGSNVNYKKLAKEITTGKEVQMTCYIIKSENGLGRSTVIDLNAPYKMNFRQIDHRTVSSLILKNVKYTVK